MLRSASSECGAVEGQEEKHGKALTVSEVALLPSFLSSLRLPTLQRADDDQHHHQQINPHFRAEETTEKIVPLKNLILCGFT